MVNRFIAGGTCAAAAGPEPVAEGVPFTADAAVHTIFACDYVAGQDREHAEVSTLALHLLRSALVHINTLLLRAVLEVPEPRCSGHTSTRTRTVLRREVLEEDVARMSKPARRLRPGARCGHRAAPHQGDPA